MPEKHTQCQKPEHLQGAPHQCSPEQIEICHGPGRDHPCQGPSDEEILHNFKKQVGFVPKPLRLMSRRPGLLEQFMAYGTTLFGGGPLSDRERFLVALSAAAALKSHDCVKAQSTRALRAGATQEEVLQAVLIAGLISNTSALHLAHDGLGLSDDNGD